ncbi:MAG: TOMM precursor leader peptide-binding protein [Roseiflexaceae bacterium]
MTQRTNPAVVMVGAGRLAQTVGHSLAEQAPVQHFLTAEALPDLPPGTLLVVVDEQYDPALAEHFDRLCAGRGLAWLRVGLEPGQAVVGPLALPNAPGCVSCAEYRRRAIHEYRLAWDELRQRFSSGAATLDSAGLAAAACDTIAALAAKLVDGYLHEQGAGRAEACFFLLRLDSLRLSRHRFVPDPCCPVCAMLPGDRAETAWITPGPLPKRGPRSYRLRPLSAAKDALLGQYLDPEAGMVRALVKDPSTLYANVSAPARLPNLPNEEIGFGRTLDYDSSQLAAIAEAIERVGGIRPGGKATGVYASYRELGDQALDPARLGLHTPEQYARLGPGYQPYTPDTPCHWVWGYSLTEARPLLVPERYAYYGPIGRQPEEQRFVYEISNGCALGSTPEEAALYGLLEIAERDAFLMTWYARLAAPRVDLREAPAGIRLLIERAEHLTGYTFHAWNITLEQGIPCFWVMAVDEQRRPDMPRALCGAGAHLLPEQALAGAIHELAPMLWRLPERYRTERAKAEAMARDPWQVQKMNDHALLYSLPEAFERLAFLYETPLHQGWGELCAALDWPAHSDLGDDLGELVARYAASGLEVIVVDQTTAEHRTGGFACVKAIVPGTLAMTFGQHTRRVTSPRLVRVPQLLGYQTHPLAASAVNPHPHPFP